MLGIRPKGGNDIIGTSVHKMWTQYKACPSQEKERSGVAIPVFYRACQGHLTFVASIERMYVPYDPGQ
eukprot:2355016-Pyramimonas_sp.AAC.1